jgi:hypothetical protein
MRLDFSDVKLVYVRKYQAARLALHSICQDDVFHEQFAVVEDRPGYLLDGGGRLRPTCHCAESRASFAYYSGYLETPSVLMARFLPLPMSRFDAATSISREELPMQPIMPFRRPEFLDVAKQSQDMAGKAKQERMAVAFQTVAMVSMALMGVTAAAHLVRDMLRQEHRERGRG